MAGHHVAVDRLRVWYTVLPAFYHNSKSPSGSICNLTRFDTSELSCTQNWDKGDRGSKKSRILL